MFKMTLLKMHTVFPIFASFASLKNVVDDILNYIFGICIRLGIPKMTVYVQSFKKNAIFFGENCKKIAENCENASTSLVKFLGNPRVCKKRIRDALTTTTVSVDKIVDQCYKIFVK
jgi:hypothetical protein